jgi:hypothetical protein
MKPFVPFLAALLPILAAAQDVKVEETDARITISTPTLDAAVVKKGYVSGIAANSLLDKKTGARDLGFGLDIIDWIMQPGSDAAYRDQLPKELVYPFDNVYHGKTPKRSIEGPQICTQAKALSPEVIRGKDFVAIRTGWSYRTAAPGYKTGSRWEQAIVLPAGKRYFVSSDKITSVNAIENPFLRLDMPGHVKHKSGDTFSEVYLSYHGKIPASEFDQPFPPDEKFRYVRGQNQMPKRFIRAYHIRDPKTGKDGPWLAGMTLRPEVVTEAWCHERGGYVCFIEEFGPKAGTTIKPGESFGAAFVVGFFDSIEEMEKTYDEYADATEVKATVDGWERVK